MTIISLISLAVKDKVVLMGNRLFLDVILCEQKRDFIHVSDFAAIIKSLVELF